MIKVRDVSHWFAFQPDRDIRVLESVTLEVPRGQFLALVGPSGCGKTTLLNMMAGLIVPRNGEVSIEGRVCISPNRNVGYMISRDSLMPWRTACANVEFGLEIRGMPDQSRQARATALLKMVGLAGFETAFPSQLSQGMRQRVALARTLAIDPAVMLFDEPFAALDAETKLLLEEDLIRIWEGSGKTVVFVTHDLAEAVALSDRVVVFSARPGHITADVEVDISRPRDLEAIRFTQRFGVIAAEILARLKKEVVRAS
ncbi:MAG TPA: ABC transporter ATP-binding protein [Bryobacteraceae bacterium]|jgi:NitT/TauT family transport system ATP-binding protein